MTLDRDSLAVDFFKCIITADWNMPLPEGKTWDEVAIARAFVMADLFIKEAETINFE